MPILNIYILEHCFGCDEARRLAEVMAARFTDLLVRVIDLEREPDARPAALVAVPTYILDGKVIALGNPRQTDLVRDLERLLGSPQHEERVMFRRRMTSLLDGVADGREPATPVETLTPSLARFAPELKVRHLSTIDIFRDLELEVLNWLADHTTMITARRGQLIYTPGETSEALFLLKVGRVRIYRLTLDGKKLVLSTLEPHTFFGDMPLAGQQMYGTFAEAVEDSTICVLGRGDLERLIRTRPQVAIRLLEVTGRRLLDAEAVIEDFAFKGIPGRLATLLLRLASDGAEDVIGYTHQDLAEMIGSYRETTTQTLDDFKRRGLIEIGRRRIRILDRRALELLTQR